jgi:nucleotide-binding universal stress UspA family protein
MTDHGLAPDAGPVTVGVDRSEESAAALRQAMTLARDLGRPLTVVHAVGLLEEGGYRSAPSLDEMVATARAAVPDASSVPVRVVREDGPAADVLVRRAQDDAATYIVVGRRGMGAAARPLGSVSEHVLARATVPVVVVSSPFPV